jgi:para-nitrobenzyl esterase
LSLWLLWLLWAVGVAAAQGDGGVVETRQGLVQGLVANGYRAFLGLPYAAPPVGDLRWRAPAAPAAWTGVRDGTLRRPDCIQGDPDRTWFQPTSEDCLYLNVWAPPVNASGAPWPVLFFIHGGSNTQGGAGIPMYNGSGVITLAPDVVVVTTNYRLNAFGFLGGAALAAESSDGANGNYGILDQRAALGWVRDNIASFGGDPARVTIFGESAGSWDVQGHLAFPGSAGLFHAAVMESGASYPGLTDVSQAEADDNYARFVAAHGCASLACLRAVPALNLTRVDGGFTWAMTADGVELPDRLGALFQRGQFTRVPVLAGSNEDEVPALAPRNLTEERYQAVVLASYGLQDGTRLLSVYPASDYASPWFAFQQLLSDSVFTCPVRRNARWMAPYTAMRMYYFTYTGGLTERIAPSLGAFHGSELPFVFNFPPLVVNDNDAVVARHFVHYWTNLAHTADPNTGPRSVGLPWPVYTPATGTDSYLLLQPALGLRRALKQAQCDVWDTIQPSAIALQLTRAVLLM